MRHRRYDDTDSVSSSESSRDSNSDTEPVPPLRPASTSSTYLWVALGAVLLLALGATTLLLTRSSASTPSTLSSSTTSPASSAAPSEASEKASPASLGSTASPSSSSIASSPSPSSSTSPFSPNGRKAGLAGGDGFDHFSAHISWWYDWSPSPAYHTAPGVIPASMLWGAGTVDATDAARLAAFRTLSAAPTYVLGFNEPDLSNSDASAGMDVKEAAALWEELVAPWQAKGSLLGSPAMGMQAGETWLTPFKQAISTQWDFTAIHVYQNTTEDVQNVIDYYADKYGKPIWITEWDMVDTSTGFTPITSQDAINAYVAACVDLFEADERIAAYAAIVAGSGLGDVWPLADQEGNLSETGEKYLEAISKYY